MRRRKRSEYTDETINLSALSGGRFPMAVLVQTLAVAEYLSFHRAAVALGVSQSSVSARIKALEEELGILLFNRNTRGVRLTDAGRRFVNEVGEAMGILDRAIKIAGMQARGEAGDLHIGVHALAAGCFLNRLLERFQTNHPGIRLQVVEGTARDAQFMIREGKLDVAFMACTHQSPDLNSRVVWRDRLMVALPVKHSLAARSDVDWRHLADETFLVRRSGTGPQVHDLIVARAAGKWLTPTILRYDVERSTLLSMVAIGHGISLLVEEGAAGSTANVAFRPIRDEPETVPFSAVWSPSNRAPALFKLLALATNVR